MSTFPLNTDQPEISEHPQNQIVLEGFNVSLLCNAIGNPTPTFSWTINGSPVNTTSNPRITFSAYNKQLTITSVKRTDGGEYKCLASNSIKTVNSTAAFLIVQCKGSFHHFPNIYLSLYISRRVLCADIICRRFTKSITT